MWIDSHLYRAVCNSVDSVSCCKDDNLISGFKLKYKIGDSYFFERLGEVPAFKPVTIANLNFDFVSQTSALYGSQEDKIFEALFKLNIFFNKDSLDDISIIYWAIFDKLSEGWEMIKDEDPTLIERMEENRNRYLKKLTENC